jgi:GT2 family glycosyltransferase
LGFLPTKVVHIDLAEELTTVTGLSGYTFIHVAVRVGEEPIGTVNVPVQGDRCPASAISHHIARHLGKPLLRLHLIEALERPAGSRRLDLASVVERTPCATSVDGSQLPTMTVAVCTRDRTDDLAQCLRALERLQHPVEVLVVDNAPSTPATARLVAKRHPQFRYVLEPRAGLDHARNRAVLETTTELLAFTDDDVVVDAAWSRAVARAFAEDPGLSALTGLVLAYELETPAQAAFEWLGGFGRGTVRRWETASTSSGQPRARVHNDVLITGRLGTGANMAFRRTMFDRIGGFDVALGAGTPARGGDDLEMFHRVLATGGVLRYEPTALVLHRHRRTLEALRSQMAGNAGLWAFMVSARAGRRASWWQIARVTVWIARWYWLGRVAHAALIPNRVPVAIPLAEVRGTVHGAITRTYRRSRRMNPEPADPLIPPGTPVDGVTTSQSAVVTVDVDGAISAASIPPQAERLSIHLNRDGGELGRFDFDTGGHPLSDRQLREVIVDELGVKLLTDHLTDDAGARERTAIDAAVAAIRVASVDDPPPVYTVSIIVTGAARPDLLGQSVEALGRHRSRHRVNVVVVDAPSHHVPVAPSAIMAAGGSDIAVMIDVDLEVADGWLDALLLPFERNDVMAVCGDVRPPDTGTRTIDHAEPSASGRLESRWADPTFVWRPFRAWELGSVSNAAFRVEVCEHPDVGTFDGTLDGDGGSELLYRIVRAGYTVVHEPAAVAWCSDDDQRVERAGSWPRQMRYHVTTLRRWHDVRSAFGIAEAATVASRAFIGSVACPWRFGAERSRRVHGTGGPRTALVACSASSVCTSRLAKIILRSHE